MQHLHFRFGPVKVKPGQNTIAFDATRQHPKVDGYITSFKPNLVRADGKAPPVDVIHLHHAVWLQNLRPDVGGGGGEDRDAAAGRLRLALPHDRPLDPQPHDPQPHAERRPGVGHVGHGLRAGVVARGEAHPRRRHRVDRRDVRQGLPGLRRGPRARGANGRYTFPDQAQNPYADVPAPRNQWVVDHDATLVGAIGHLHPGGLYTDLTLTRGGRTVRLFRSRAHYFEPAGAVSWDVAMTATPSNWRVRVKRGDVLAVHGTYDTSRASWYEAMAIMPVAATRRPVGGADPFATKVDVPGVLTHGHLPENDHHGGGFAPYANPAALPDGPRATEVDVSGFLYGQGDLSLPDARRLPPVVAPGQPLTFVNRDASRDIFHTITGCRLPCNGLTGIAFPLADGPVFDSGELGFGPAGFTAAANRATWSTPATLDARHVRLLLPRAPVHAGRLPRQGVARWRSTSASSSSRPTRRPGCSRTGPASAATAS